LRTIYDGPSGRKAVSGVDAVARQFEELAAQMRERGMGQRMGAGRRPALIAVDFSQAFTSPDSPVGGDFSAEMAVTNTIVRAGRSIDMLAVYSVVKYQKNLRDSGAWYDKMPLGRATADGTKLVELDPQIACGEQDIVLPKKYPSVFFGTDLTTILQIHGIDTLIVTGITTSGCVRATVVDACSLGFRTLVVREGCADRHPLPHEANLFDMDMKYADVVTLEQTLEYLESLGAAAHSPVGVTAS
jgi:maleamate amidohydrolase